GYYAGSDSESKRSADFRLLRAVKAVAGRGRRAGGRAFHLAVIRRRPPEVGCVTPRNCGSLVVGIDRRPGSDISGCEENHAAGGRARSGGGGNSETELRLPDQSL